LHLSDKKMSHLYLFYFDDELQKIKDDFSKDVIILKIETILNNCNRFFKITHFNISHLL